MFRRIYGCTLRVPGNDSDALEHRQRSVPVPFVANPLTLSIRRLCEREPISATGGEHVAVHLERRWGDVQSLSLSVLSLLPHTLSSLYVVVIDLLVSSWLNSFPTVWSNFEIASLDFWRGEQYSKFFDHLDKSGGFYYEVRAPSPSATMESRTRLTFWIAVGRRADTQHRRGAIREEGADPFLQRDRCIPLCPVLLAIPLLTCVVRAGYSHSPLKHCPQGEAHARGKCWCDPLDSFGA